MELGPILTEFYTPTTSSNRKQQLEQELHAFRMLPNAHLTSLEIIVAMGERREQQDLFVVYFCGCTLEAAIRRRWSSIPKEERLNIRKFLFQYLAASHASLPRWVSTKLGKALVDVAKVSWPREDPDFMTELQQLASRESTRALGLDLLSLVSEEFVRLDSPLPSGRRRELKAALVWVIPSVLQVLGEVVAVSRDAAAGVGEGASDAAVKAAREAVLGAARCLLVIVSWAPLTNHLTIDLFRSLFGIVEAAAQVGGEGGRNPAGSPSLQECGATCVACVTEVVSKRLLPPEQQDMVLGMADHMLSLLKIFTSGGTIRPGLNDDFLMQMAEFLGAFMEANLGRVLGMGGVSSGGGGVDDARKPHEYPIGELLSLLAAFTFAQRTAQGLQRCLRAWSAFVAQATVEEGEGSAADRARSATLARDNAAGLQSVCQALLEKSLFITNRTELEELDDDRGINVQGSGGSRTEGDDRGGGEEEEYHGQGQAATAGGDGGGVSELEDFLGEVRAVLLASARVPGVGAPFSESVLGAFSTVLERLERASQSAPSAAGNEGDAGGGGYVGAAQEAQRLAVDAATLCALMPATAAAAGGGTPSHGDSGGGGSREESGGGDLILRAGEAMVRAARAMAEAGLRGRGPEFAALEAAALGAVAALLPGLATSGDGSNATGIAEAVVSLVRHCWEEGTEVAGREVVALAAGRLLLSLTSVLPPHALEASAAVNALLKDAGQVSQSLPVGARVLLYESLSAFLLPPKLLEGDMRRVNDLDGRSREYSEMLAPILVAFSAAYAGWQNWTGPSPWPGFSDAGVSGALCASCRVISRLCRSFTSTPSKARRVLYQALAPALRPIVALAPLLLENASGNFKEAASAARALLKVQVSVVETLGQEAGPSFASEAVGSLAAASPHAGVGSGSGGRCMTPGMGEAGPAWLSSAVFRLLTSVVRTRNASTKALVPQACGLALGRLHALGRLTGGQRVASEGWGDSWLEGPVVETLPDFLDLSKELLVTQWHCFVPSAASRGMATSLASAIAARSQRQDATATPNDGRRENLSGAGFASEEMASHFEGLMYVLRLTLSLPTKSSGGGGSGQEGHSVPPDVVRRGLQVLEGAHREAGGLFRFPPFASRWLEPILTDALRGLTEGAHPLLQEEVRHLVFGMAEINHASFVTQFLPHFLATYYPWLGETHKETLLSPWRAGTHLDAPTFSSFLEDFVSDLGFFRAQAEAA